MNREQRRAQLKQLGKKFSGLDITKGTIDIPIRGGEDHVTLDLMSFDTIYYLSEMIEKFTDPQSAYGEDFTAIDSIKDKSKRTFATVRVYKKIIDDFTYSVDKIFGVGATKRIFDNEAPMPQGIAEFIEDLTPILQAISTLITNESSDVSNVQSVLSSSINTKYSGDRLGNV